MQCPTLNPFIDRLYITKPTDMKILIIREESLYMFQEKLNHYLSNGWELHGDFTIQEIKTTRSNPYSQYIQMLKKSIP